VHKIKSGIGSELCFHREWWTSLLGDDVGVARPPVFNLRQTAHHVAVVELAQRIIAIVAVARVLALSIDHGALGS
jgi:hypothetical protein